MAMVRAFFETLAVERNAQFSSPTEQKCSTLTSISNHGSSSLQKSAVGELSKRRLEDLAFSSHLGVLHEHVGPWYSDVGELTV